MGKCQSQPSGPEPQLVMQPSSLISSSIKQKQSQVVSKKDLPNPDFAIPVNQIPKLTKQALSTLQKLGPFKYENCGNFSHGVELRPYKLRNGSIYVGEWLNGKTNGKGKYYLPDNSLFEGVSIENEIQGFGRIIHSNGDYFQGQIKKSKANGQGIYVQGDLTYQGTFKNNLQHGKGIQYSNLYQFQGFFSEGEKQKGTLTLKNRQKYEYNGEFKSNKYHGYGVLINDVGKYEGQFKNGLKHGYGKFSWADGSYYEGEYRNDQKHGDGKLYDKKNKLIREGIWEHNNIAN